MKYVKMLGLAAVAAAAVMAFVGASSASATVLCLTEGTGATTGTTCPEGWAVPAGSEIHAVLENGATEPATLTTSFKNIECKVSTVSGKTTNEGGASETVVGHIESLTFEECNCEVKVLKKGTLEVHWIPDTHNGTLTSSGAEVTTTCSTLFGNVHCIYATNNTDLNTLTGSAKTGATPTLDVESAPINVLETNGLCPTTSKWDAKYVVTTPMSFNVTDHT